MSARNGDKARFHRIRKIRLARRVSSQELRRKLAGAKEGEAAPKQ